MSRIKAERRELADMGVMHQPVSVPEALIAIVEDDRAVLNSLQFSLESLGYAVCGFAHPADALDGGEIMAADCLVIDYALPDVDGLSLLKELRSRGLEAPAVIIASTPTVRCRQEAALAGVEVIEKPLMGDGLVQRIGDLLAAKTA